MDAADVAAALGAALAADAAAAAEAGEPPAADAAPDAAPAGATSAIRVPPGPALEWARGAAPDDVALALELGSRCLQAIGRGAARAAAGGSAERGARGEDEVYELLARARPVRDVSRRAHSGDLVCDARTGPVYVEVKHYARSVPAAEVDKFLRDLRERDAAAGVIISLSSPIVGQRRAIAVALEPRVSAGTLVPVVYAAPMRASGQSAEGQSDGGRLAAEVALAAVDVAVALADVYPRGVRGLRSRDAALAFAAAADQLAAGAAAARADLTRLGAGLVDGFAAAADQTLRFGREARDLAAELRAEVEEVGEAASSGAESFAAELCARYRPAGGPPAAPLVARVVAAAEAASPAAAGLLGEENRWRLLKGRAVHIPTGCALAFLKGATEVRLPAPGQADRIAALLVAHPKKVRFADGELALELDASTVDDVIAAIG